MLYKPVRDDNFPIDVVSGSGKSVEQISMDQPIMAVATTLVAAVVRETLTKLLAGLYNLTYPLIK